MKIRWLNENGYTEKPFNHGLFRKSGILYLDELRDGEDMEYPEVIDAQGNVIPWEIVESSTEL